MFSSNTSQVASSAANYIEDVFSTWLYTGNASTLAINNGVDLSGKGGLVWVKSRNTGARNNILVDTARGRSGVLRSNTTGAQATSSAGFDLVSFNSNGFTVGQPEQDYLNNGSSETYASWTFRKQAKFFDVVTWTGDGSASRSISHNLGSVPGCVIVKRTDTAASWLVFHRSVCVSANQLLFLDRTDALTTTGNYFPNGFTSSVTSTSLNNIGSGSSINASGGTFVAYLFAHDDGGFGLSGTDNVISCGSVSVASGTSNAVVNLGYEPQWVLWRNANVTDNWYIFDNMRGIGAFNTAQQLNPNLSDAESTIGSATYPINITSTGFSFNAGNFGWGASSNKFIYIAIRRGPMKTPTSGTSVYTTDTRNAGSVGPRYTSGFPVDMSLRVSDVTDSAHNTQAWDRLRGDLQNLNTNTTAAETTLSSTLAPVFGFNTGIATLSGATSSSSNDRAWMFQRAPSFMDVVCYTGTDNDIALTHNLGVAPEAIILKKRSSSGDWAYETNFTSTQHTSFTLNDTIAGQAWNYSSGIVLTAQPTSTTVTVAGGAYSTSGSTYVMYMFASCSGVSKVGSYTGTGTTKQIDCGFTGGARFVLIKRTDSTGDWYVWDSARGIVSGNDPYLLLNSTAAQVTNTDYVDTYSAGFEISSTAPAAINANGGTFIFLAIA